MGDLKEAIITYVDSLEIEHKKEMEKLGDSDAEALVKVSIGNIIFQIIADVRGILLKY